MKYPLAVRGVVLLISLVFACGGDDGGEQVDTQEPTSASQTGGDTPCGPMSCDPVTEVCDWSANSCGNEEFDEPTCEPRPTGCSKELDPVCGCDGVVYDNPCFAQRAGVDLDENGQCTAPPGTGQCGFRFCDPLTTYCQKAVSDVTPEPTAYTCRPLPGDCPEPIDCTCVSGEPCFSPGCQIGPTGLISLLCPGG